MRQRNDQTCLTQPTRFGIGVAFQATKGTQASSHRFFCNGIVFFIFVIIASFFAILVKDFGRKLQTNVPVTESESESSCTNQIPISERIYTPFSHKDAKESNTNSPILPILRLNRNYKRSWKNNK